MCAMEIANRHCIVWFKDNRWSFFTNEFWLTPKESVLIPESSVSSQIKKMIKKKLLKLERV